MKIKYMKMALRQANKAFDIGNTPIGCVIVCNDHVVSRAYNMKNSKNNAIYHAEIIAISRACKKLKSWHLDECEMYVTLEPCNMCFGAINEARIKKVYYLLDSNYHMNDTINLNVKEKTDDIFNYELMLSDFFKNIRK